jgi:hypothetical protein
MRRAHVILVDGASSEQLEAAHSALKDEPGWWRNSANAWIVLTDKNFTQLRDIVSAAVRGSGGQPKVLVLQLPTEQSDRRWAVSGHGKALHWLSRSYHAEEPPAT